MKRLFANELFDVKNKINKLKEDKDNVALFGDIQDTLLEYHYWLESKHSFRKLRLKKLQGMKKNIENTKEISLRIKASISKTMLHLKELKELKLWLRNIGNSLPHLYYHKGDLRAYSYSTNSEGLKELSGDIHGKDGLELELKCVRHAIDNGSKALLNDLTSIMRYGDITLMDKGFPFLMEIKNSDASKSKSEKQLKNMQGVQRYLTDDFSMTLRGGGVISQRIEMSEDEKSNKDTINEHLNKSKKNGYNFSKIEDGLYCLSFFHGSDYQNKVDTSELSSLENPAFFSLNQFKNNEDNSLFYPFALLIDDPQIFTSFMVGYYSIYFFFDAGLLHSTAKELNLEFNFISEFYLVEMRNKENIQIYSYTLTKALVEFSSINWAIKQMFNSYNTALNEYDKFKAIPEDSHPTNK